MFFFEVYSYAYVKECWYIYIYIYKERKRLLTYLLAHTTSMYGMHLDCYAGAFIHTHTKHIHHTHTHIYIYIRFYIYIFKYIYIYIYSDWFFLLKKDMSLITQSAPVNTHVAPQANFTPETVDAYVTSQGLAPSYGVWDLLLTLTLWPRIHTNNQ